MHYRRYVARQQRSDYRPETSLQIRRLLCAAQGRIFRDKTRWDIALQADIAPELSAVPRIIGGPP